MVTIYILQCENERYYVGKTYRPISDRIEEHFNNNGSEWTKKYKPIKMIEFISDADEFDEDKYTKIYMAKYGINKVRGGSYTQISLPESDIIMLNKEICSASNLCFKCKKSGHFMKDCSDRSDRSDRSDLNVNGSIFSVISNIFKNIFNIDYTSDEDNESVCFRCKRIGHFTKNCYAFTDKFGKKLTR